LKLGKREKTEVKELKFMSQNVISVF